jgi:hypothetical protein
MDSIDYSLDNTTTNATSITNDPVSDPTTLSDVIKVLEKYCSDNHLDKDFNNGLTKNITDKFDVKNFMKSLNLLMQSFILNSNKDIQPNEKNIIQTYFNTANEQINFLNYSNFNLAGREYLINIIGYIINCLKNSNFNKL